LKGDLAVDAATDLAGTIVAIEEAALERWGRGDPDGFLEISAPDVVYFDPYVERRIDGLAALADYYAATRGVVKFDRFELVNPKVQAQGDMAVLTFNYVSHRGAAVSRWNCTEVYARRAGAWRIIQTHWSYTARGG
jgi:ketosteroid isomerase-like protein